MRKAANNRTEAPRTDEKVPTRGRIVRAAIRRFSEKGYAGTSVREIAAGAGISEAAIYRHFSGKEAVLDAALEEFRVRVYAPLPSDGSGRVARELIVPLPSMIMADPVLRDCSRFILGEMHVNEKVRSFAEAAFGTGAERLIVSRLEAGLPRGASLSVQAVVAARLINAARFGLLYGALFGIADGSVDIASLEKDFGEAADLLDAASSNPAFTVGREGDALKGRREAKGGME